MRDKIKKRRQSLARSRYSPDNNRVDARRCKDFMLTVFNDCASDKLVSDLERVVEATDHLVGQGLRKELFSSINMDKYGKIARIVPGSYDYILIEGTTVKVKRTDKYRAWHAALCDGDRMFLTVKDSSPDKVDYRDYLHEIGHGMMSRMDSDYVLGFRKLYNSLLDEFIDLVRSGTKPVEAAESICSWNFFIEKYEPDTDGLICWKGFVGRNSAYDEDLANVYSSNKSVKRPVLAYRILTDFDEAFAETFAYYFRLKRRPEPYSFVPGDFLANKSEKLYSFCKENMEGIIGSAQLSNRVESRLGQ